MAEAFQSDAFQTDAFEASSGGATAAGVTISAAASLIAGAARAFSAAITSPTNASTVTLAPTEVAASLTSSAGSVTRAVLKVNGVAKVLDDGSPWGFFWAPPTAGTYTLAVEATDAAANVETSPSIVVTVADVSPLRFPIMATPGVKEADIVISGTPYDIIDGDVYADGTTTSPLANFYDADIYPEAFNFTSGVIRHDNGTDQFDVIQLVESWEAYAAVTDFRGVNGWGGMALQEILHPTGSEAAAFGNDVLAGTDTFDVNRVEPSTLRSKFGSKSLRVVCEAASANPTITKASLNNALFHAARGDTIFADFWLYIEDGTPLGIIDFECSHASDSPGVRLLLNSSLVPRLESKFFHKPSFAASSSIAADQWVHIELEVGLHESSGEIRLRVDGTLLINATGQTLPVPSMAYDRVQIGVTANSEATAVLLYVDELKVWTRPQAAPQRSQMLMGMGV